MESPDSGSGPDFIHFESGFRSGPAPDFSHSRAGSVFYQATPGPSPCPGPEFTHFESGSGFYKCFRMCISLKVNFTFILNH